MMKRNLESHLNPVEKTPYELYLEEKIRRLEQELKSRARNHSVFDAPDTLRTSNSQTTLSIAAYGGLSEDESSYHIWAKSHEGRAISYQVDKDYLHAIRPEDMSRVMYEIVRNMAGKLSSLFFEF